MRIKDLLSEEKAAIPPKPRNFVAKNAKMGGAGQHKDKKKAEKQGDAKHKKDLATMESQGVAEGFMSELDIEIGDMLDGHIAKYQDGLLDADHLGAMIDKAGARLAQKYNADANEMTRHVSNHVADALGEE